VVREVREETGLTVEPVELVGSFHRTPGPSVPHHSVVLTYVCDVVDGELRLSHEGDDLQYWSLDAVSEWFTNHRTIATEATEVRASD